MTREHGDAEQHAGVAEETDPEDRAAQRTTVEQIEDLERITVVTAMVCPSRDRREQNECEPEVRSQHEREGLEQVVVDTPALSDGSRYRCELSSAVSNPSFSRPVG